MDATVKQPSSAQLQMKVKQVDECRKSERLNGFCNFPLLQISLTFPSGPHPSNLQQFLECTTPRVPCQFLSKRDTCRKALSASTEPMLFFSLGDLWDSFDEWSAYGVGVPIVLNDGKGTVVQYYVPYLSALQLYGSPTTNQFSKTRMLGDGNESSDMDVGDSNSDSSSDSETERQMRYKRTQPLQGFQNGCTMNFDRHTEWNSDIALEEFEAGDKWQDKGPGLLLFEYFETAAPSVRVPLFDKIAKLVHAFPKLRSLNSFDFVPSSWMSIAWYPIYRIPTGPRLLDLATCFLTYHSLSTYFPEQQQIQLSSFTRWQQKVFLQPFGLASYKLQGTLWNSADNLEQWHVMSLQNSADSWIKRLHVHHPDYEYFLSYSPPFRHRMKVQS